MMRTFKGDTFCKARMIKVNTYKMQGSRQILQEQIFIYIKIKLLHSKKNKKRDTRYLSFNKRCSNSNIYGSVTG
uniref:Uncharacterized protein n=1 Tax=Lepeophtheirus salmonis TaxID=72036 RepID=A0A0K2UMN4_LEPSM